MSTQTTTPADETADAATTQRPNGPGAQLRQARLDLKLAPEDVARILHLSSRQIIALENDDYDNLPGPTYIRGYLRGYAQLLGLSAETIVEAYGRIVTAKKPVDLAKLAPKPEIRSDHQLIKFATVGVVVIVLGLSAVWWQEQERPAAPTRELTSQPTTAPEEMPQESETKNETTMEPGPRGDSPVVSMPASDAIKNVPTPKPATITAAPVKAAPAAASGDAPTTPFQVEPTGPRGRLVLRTTLDSWADVRDAGDNRLLYEIIPAGRTVSVEGAMPLSVFLGNAEGVRVEFNGQAYDISRYRRGDIARFTLGTTSETPAGTP